MGPIESDANGSGTDPNHDTIMNPITLECPQCHEIITSDESLYGQPDIA